MTLTLILTLSSTLIEGGCVLFIDEIDTLCPKRDGASKRTARPVSLVCSLLLLLNLNQHRTGRLVAQLLTLLDGVGGDGGEAAGVMLIAATNRPNDLDAALRRPGRLDREIAVRTRQPRLNYVHMAILSVKP